MLLIKMSIVIVYSNWTILKIFNFFADYLDATKEEIGMFKIISHKDRNGIYKHTNKCLFLIKNSLFIRALEYGLEIQQHDLDFRMTNFNLNEEYHYPKEGYNLNLFIKIPKNLNAVDCEILMKEKMNTFVKFDLISEKEYNMKIPLESRLTGEHKGYILVDFSGVEADTIAYIKLLLHGSIFYMGQNNVTYNISAFWRKNY